MTLGPRPVVGETRKLAVGFGGGELCDWRIGALLKKLAVIVRGRPEPRISVIQLQRGCTFGVEVEAALDTERLNVLNREWGVVPVFNRDSDLPG